MCYISASIQHVCAKPTQQINGQILYQHTTSNETAGPLVMAAYATQLCDLVVAISRPTLNKLVSL